MDELVNQIAQKTGIGQEKSRQAAETAISFLKSKFPSLAGHLDSVLEGHASQEAGTLSEKAKSEIGGIFGKKTA